jgi:hypothetical protein
MERLSEKPDLRDVDAAWEAEMGREGRRGEGKGEGRG